MASGDPLTSSWTAPQKQLPIWDMALSLGSLVGRHAAIRPDAAQSCETLADRILPLTAPEILWRNGGIAATAL